MSSSAWLHGILMVCCAMVVFLAAFLDVVDGNAVRVPYLNWTLPELCNTRRWLGVECLGCGLTRSFIHMAHGNLTEAWNLHAVGAVLFVVIVACVPLEFANWIRALRGQHALVSEKGFERAVIVFLVAMVVHGLIRWSI